LEISLTYKQSLKAAKCGRRVGYQGVGQTLNSVGKRINFCLSVRVMSRRILFAGRQSPGTTISSELLHLGGFGQPTIGPYAELHTFNYDVRLLAYINHKWEKNVCSFSITCSCLNCMYASVAFSECLHSSIHQGGGVYPPHHLKRLYT